MKRFFDWINNYITGLDWKDLVCIKLCTAALGVLVGLLLQTKHKKLAAIMSSIVFINTAVFSLYPLYKRLCPRCRKSATDTTDTTQPEEEGFVMRIVSEN